MSIVKEVIEELDEPEIKYILVDGNLVTVKAVIDRILNEDNVVKKRKLCEG